MKLGSLFDGSGGFQLAGTICGMEPVWASEIEPYPIRVTAARFPRTVQLGDVAKINGAEIEPVDVITFGSPCQDLSVAGKRAGIHEGERSSLFFEAARIIKEMRDNDASAGRTNEHIRPRFAVWENVPGAFSSNKGADFQAVLQALCQVCDPDMSIPMPEKGKWHKAGCIVGDGYSIAWRVYDAQFWGVPQRRKRIYLVADFGSERAGEILFEPESVRGDLEEGRETREGTTSNAPGSAGGSDCAGCLSFHLQQDPISNRSVSLCISGQRQASVGIAAAFMGGQGAKAGSIGYSEQNAPTIKAVASGSNQVPDVVYQNTGISWWNEAHVAETLRTPCGGDSTKANLVVYALQGNGIDCAETAGCNGKGWRENECYTLNTIDRPAVVYDGRGNGDGKTVPTLTGDHQNRVTDYTSLCVARSPRIGQYTDDGTSKPQRRYIVRRLTPLECCRLQGFPDWWEEGVDGSDSARYKMWGNGIALPCAVDVLRRIANA